MNETDRRLIRRAFKCPCDSVSQNVAGRERLPLITDLTDRFSKAVETITNVRPTGCPWYPKQTQLIQDLNEQIMKGRIHPTLMLTDDLPKPIYDAVVWYQTFLENAKGYYREQDDKERERKRKLQQAK